MSKPYNKWRKEVEAQAHKLERERLFKSEHPAPTPDLLLTDEEIHYLIGDYRWYHATSSEKERLRHIAQAQLSKLQQARPTTEQARENLIEWITDYKDVAERNALAETPEESAEYLLSTLLPFPDEQGIRQSERKAIGDWLEKYRPYILDGRFHKGVASLKAGEPPQGSVQ